MVLYGWYVFSLVGGVKFTGHYMGEAEGLVWLEGDNGRQYRVRRGEILAAE